MGLSRRAAIVASGRIATTASILVVNALLARAWSPELFGTFSAIWILGNTLVPFFLLGIPGALLYALPRRTANTGTLLTQTTTVLGLSALVLCAVLWIGAPAISQANHGLTAEYLRGFLLAFLPYVFCVVAGGHIESILVATGRPFWQAGISWLGAALLMGSAAAAYHMGWSVQQTLISLSAAAVLRLMVAYALLTWTGLSRPSGDGLGDFLRYAVTIGTSEGIGSVSRSVDRLVVLVLLDPSRLGIYHLGAIEVPVSLVLASLVTVMVPEVSRLMAAAQTEQVADLFRVAVVRLSWLILPLFFFLYVFAADVMALYLPPEYADSEDVFRCFLLMLPLRCAIYNPILVGSGRANWALLGALGDLLINASVSVVLVLWLRDSHPSWALLGPAMATVGATYVQVTVLLLAMAHLLQRSLWRLVPWGHLLRVSLFAVAAALVAYWMTTMILDSAGPRLLLGALLMAAGVWGIPALLAGDDRRELAAILHAIWRRESK